jgi:hypothetical protein
VRQKINNYFVDNQAFIEADNRRYYIPSQISNLVSRDQILINGITILTKENAYF